MSADETGLSREGMAFPGNATAAVRGVGVAGHIVYGLLLGVFYPAASQSVRRAMVRHWSRTLLWWLRVGVETRGDYRHIAGRGRLVLANHVSWLDVVALNAIAPSRFVAKAEVAGWPLLGLLCRRAGTLFIRRDVQRDVLSVNERIADVLGRGECVALFPEGTTGADEHPGSFHASLLQGALDAHAVIQPVAIRYHDDSGRHNGAAFFVGGMTFIQSLWRVLCSPALHVTLVYLPPLVRAGQARRVLARQAQGAIHTALSMLSGLHAVHVPAKAHASVAVQPAGYCYSGYSLLLDPMPGKRPSAGGRSAP